MENKEETSQQYYKKLTVEDVEKAILKLQEDGIDNPFDYPKYCGEGIYEISKGCYTNEKGMEEFMKQLRNE